MFDRRISMITLGVADIERSASFYEKLGWKRSAASQEIIAFFALKGIVLALFARASLAHDAGIEDSGAGFPGVALAHNLADEAGVDQAYAHAIACGARPVKTPQKVFWGGYSGYFADPDDHLWEIAFNPLAPLDSEGHMQLPAAQD